MEAAVLAGFVDLAGDTPATTAHPSLIRHSTFVLRHLVNVALVAFIALQFFDVFVRFVDIFAAVLLHNFA